MKNNSVSISVLAILICSLFLSGCTKAEYDANYIGYFYPNGSFSSNYTFIESGPLNTLEECHSWINSMKTSYIKNGYPLSEMDYECGEGCNYGDIYNAGTTYTCEISVY